MAIQKTITHKGIDLSYWRIINVLSVNPDTLSVEVAIAGYVNQASRDADTKNYHKAELRNVTIADKTGDIFEQAYTALMAEAPGIVSNKIDFTDGVAV